MDQPSRNITAKFMPWDDFQARLRPFDRRLPDDVDHDLYAKQLSEMKLRLREQISDLGTEGDDWELPPDFQDALVFYLYLNTPTMYKPGLIEALASSMSGHDGAWIAEIECFDPPLKPGGITFLAYHNGELWADDGEETRALVSQLQIH